jgi:hypothetical protein
MAKRILIVFLLAGVWIGPEDLSSCGPFLPVTIFSGKFAPFDEPRFFRGQLDILQPQYRRIYLMAAYRYLTGIGLSQADQQALLAKPAGEASYPWADPGSPAVQGWLRVRVEVGAPRLEQINRFEIQPDHSYILNCGDDAFRNAAATLIEHGRAGASHDDLRAWVAAQDQVFANCSAPGGPSIPATLPATAAQWMQADRAYQIAAANFYAGDFDAASADFLRIAADRSSPWHGIAPYLAARALIRKSTLVDPAASPAAEAQLRQVLADPDAAAWRQSARDLARYLRAHTEPERALDEFAHTVATEKTGVAGVMNDYRLMLGRYLDTGKQPPFDEDITDWIAAMAYSPPDRALVKWRETRSLPWLVAALTHAYEPDPELMKAAAQVARTSPAFPTVEFHRLRLLPADEARPRLDAELLHKMPVSARNQFLAARMRVARDWSELLRDAPRTAAGTFVEGEGEAPATAQPAYFDDDGARILDRHAPLAILVRAAQSPSLPPNLQLQVARAVWVRSILLHDAETAKGIAPALAAAAPYLKPYLDLYLAAPDENARTFAAVWLLLNNPGMRPSIGSGAGRTSSTPLIDSFRDNWWCAVDESGLPMNVQLELLYQGDLPEARFLSAAERAAVGQEQKRLDGAPEAPTFMARQTVEWVEAHPGDPRAAEALRLAVRAGHYACSSDAETDRWVKRAFGVLHSRYGKTEAARRTPFWYRNK